MSQDHVNDQVSLIEPQAVATVPNELSQSVSSTKLAQNASTEESQVLADAINDTPSVIENDVSDDVEELGEEDDASDEMAVNENASPLPDTTATASSTIASANTADVEADDRCEIEKQPYHFDQCTVQIAIQLLPDDGDAHGRMVVVGVRSHLDSPLLRLVRLNQLGTLPPLVSELLDALKTELPTREQAAREAFEKKKEERAQRKAAITASKTVRGKKTKATLATAPASSNATTDNRPRPEVQVTTAPQQQIGLF